VCGWLGLSVSVVWWRLSEGALVFFCVLDDGSQKSQVMRCWSLSVSNLFSSGLAPLVGQFVSLNRT
jgi:hypothetical protein